MMRRLLVLIVLTGFIARLWYGLAQDPMQPYTQASNDSVWYLANAYALVADLPLGSAVNGFVTDVSLLGQPPVYFLVIGLPQRLFPHEAATITDPDTGETRLDVRTEPPQAIQIVRIAQAILSTITCLFAYRMAYLLVVAGSRKGGSDKLTARAQLAGVIAAAALALSPVFVMEAAEIKTETVFIFFVAGGLWLFLEALSLETVAREDRRSMLLALAGVLLALATLTRAVFMLFPLALGVYLLVVGMGWRRALTLVITYALVVSTWTIYNYAHWQRWVIAGTGLDGFLYVGATGWDDPQAVDERLLATQSAAGAAETPLEIYPGATVESEDSTPEAAAAVATASATATEAAPEPTPEPIATQTPVPPLDFAEGARSAILSDIPGYIRRRVTELAGAYLQPHGTLFFPGESLRALAADWLRDDRSLSGLIALTQGDAFWAKLLVYVLHYAALLLGLLGMWRTRRQWRLSLPLLGFIVYTTLIHLVLYALPRYLFPTMIVWWVFAAAGIVKIKSDEKY